MSYSQDGSSGGILGNVVSSSDNVYLETNSPMVHQLLLSTSGTHTEPTIPSSLVANNLTGTNTQETSGSLITNTYIAPIGNTTTSSLSSASALSPNTWGFALASTTPGIVTNNFNTASEYTSTDQSIQNTNKYASVPTSGNEVLLTQDTTGTSSTTIYYGVLADRDIPAGSYGNTVLYTALAEQPSEIRVVANNTMDPAVIPVATPEQTITIYTSINTTDSDLGTAEVKLYSGSSNNEVATCTNPSVQTSSDNYLYVTCTTPIVPATTYGIKLTLNKYGRVLTNSNAITYATDNTQVFGGIVYMQQMTSAICTNATETTSYTSASTLIDSRGKGNAGSQTGTYKVIKAKDGNCWMADNLNLYNTGASSSEKQLNSTNTDIPSGTYTIPTGITATTDWNTNNYQTKKVEISHGLGQHASQDQQYWNEPYYNWTVAVAKETTAGVTTAPDTSICPKGWTLPTNGDKGVNKSWAKLLDVYGIDTGAKLLANSTLGFTKYYGNWDWHLASEGGQGSNSLFWSGTPSAETTAYSLYYNSGSVNPQNNNSKGGGFSIRCVAR